MKRTFLLVGTLDLDEATVCVPVISPYDAVSEYLLDEESIGVVFEGGGAGSEEDSAFAVGA